MSTFYATHKRERTIQQVRIREGQTVEEALREYRRDPLVAHAQPNYLFRMQAVPPLPNDPRFGELWGLHNTGQVVDGMIGTPDADIDAPEAWGITTGSADVIIAVIDTGVNYLHPELAGNMWVNPGEIAGDGVDNDGNGFIDDIHGWDFFDNDNSPMDFNTHGTHVAGTIAAAGNNAVGITGVMWDAQIMALKVSGVEAMLAPLSAIAPAINYAAANGAHIINASWGRLGTWDEDVPGNILRDAIEVAGTVGVLFVAAAGNDGNNNDVIPSFPDGYTLPNIISVAATDQDDNLAGCSNFGETSVDVAAPGVRILSTVPTFSFDPPEILYDSAGFDDYPLDASPPTNWVNIANQPGIANTWAITNIYSLSPHHSFADNPGIDYINNLVSTATLTYLNDTPITYTKDSRYWLTFDIRYDIASGDWFDIVVSSDDRATWDIYDGFTGSSGGAFASRAFDLTLPVEHFRATGAYLGFGIDSDESITGEGVYIDNLLLLREPILIDPYDPATNYAYYPGTSMAAPHVAGLAGLLLSRSPNLTVAELRTAILDGVDHKGLLIATGGRINAYNSLLKLPPTLSVSPASRNLGNVTIGQSRNRNFYITNTGGHTSTTSGPLSITDISTPLPPFTIISAPSVPFDLITNETATITVKFEPTTVGSFSDTITFTSNVGNLTRDVSGIGSTEPPPMENGCLIATAAFGTPLAQEVEVLSRLRDRYLLTNELGQRFVALYERHSPQWAEFISEREWAKRMVRMVLRPIVRIAEFIVD